MAKRLVEIDDALLERARSAAGTSSIKATVEAGLRQLADQSVVVEHIRRLRRSAPLDRARLAQSRASRIPLK